MATVVADRSMSLDGFIAGPNDRIDEIFAWMGSGDVEVPVPNKHVIPAFHVDEASAGELRKTLESLGAIVTGRRTFDLAGGWAGAHPMDAPVWIVTHNPPDGYDDAPFTFVRGGRERRRAGAGGRGRRPGWRGGGQHRPARPERRRARCRPDQPGARPLGGRDQVLRRPGERSDPPQATAGRRGR